MSHSNTLSENVTLGITLESGISPRSFEVYRNDHRLGSIFLGYNNLWYNSGNRIGYAKREDAIASVLNNPKPICQSTIVDSTFVPF